MITALAKLLKVLNSEADPAQIALAFSFALLSGFLPFFSPVNTVVLLLVLLLRVNLSAYLLGTGLFAGVAYLLDPLFSRIGLALLTAAPLEGLWTNLYNSTIWRIQKFNNTVVMGGFAFAVLLFVPLFLLCTVLIRQYREHVLSWVRKTRLMQMIMATKFYSVYEKVSGWTGGAA
jgi:uncharacterized protein (TIGR03546 family)